MTNDAPTSATAPPASETTVPAGYLRDSMGRLVPESLVSTVDKLRDALVGDLIAKALAVQAVMISFKEESYGEVGAFAELSASQYKAKVGGSKGNMQLPNFSGTQKVQIQVSETLAFDERIRAAEALINECLTEWTADSRSEIKVIVQDAFRVDKAGELSTARILSLRSIAIDDPRWMNAMKAINDSLRIARSTSYIRFYRRKDADSPWEPISLDMAKL